jgi:hypothetical protein
MFDSVLPTMCTTLQVVERADNLQVQSQASCSCGMVLVRQRALHVLHEATT